MPDPFIGEIRGFGFTFAPQGWMTCGGQLLSISSNSALFSLLGTTYGGDGQTTFGLPDLRGRVSVSFGQGDGLQNYAQGQVGGSETVTLTADEVPPHTHPVAASTQATSKSPSGAVPGFTGAGSSYGTTEDAVMSDSMIGPNSGGSAHANLQPFLVLNWCIAVEGVYPSRS